MYIFVINSGSSSLKYQLFNWPSPQPVCVGLVERIGLEGSTITHKIGTDANELIVTSVEEIANHNAALQAVNRLLTEGPHQVIADTGEVKIVGHRIVHGGEYFVDTTVITPEVKEKLRLTFQLAPLHNPPAYSGLEVAEKVFSGATHIGVFDTSFFQTLPEKAYRYAIPKSFYTQHHIRVYGFHGTSHKYVSQQAYGFLGKPDAKLITIHLGNGCSISAVKAGKAVDTSMGFGPLEGLIMGTRSGSIDPTVIFYLENELGYNAAQVSNLLNKQSGMIGLTGFSDMRDITKAMNAGDADAKLAYDLYTYRIKKYIGAYAAAMNGVDAIIFTAGVGENDALIRKMVCSDMDYLGIELNKEKNLIRDKNARDISVDGSRVRILIVPTNEELEIAQQCADCVIL
ncbi:MAG: acetate kinase [Sphingobacteriaceae bacterium]|nr:MAG: acetate kinase [Sphingobacteriaceae bacterium]